MRHIIATSLMLSSMIIPAVAHASSSKDDVTAPTSVRVSTGVIAPSLVAPISVQLPDGLARTFLPMDNQVALTLTVDANGTPQNVKVVKSSNPYWDARVVDAVSKSHFTPGKIDETAIPVDMNLTVKIAR